MRVDNLCHSADAVIRKKGYPTVNDVEILLARDSHIGTMVKLCLGGCYPRYPGGDRFGIEIGYGEWWKSI
jgi:hypothetical protein